MIRALLVAALCIAGCCGCRSLAPGKARASVVARDLRHWDIVLPAAPQPAEQYAAEELRRLFCDAAGVALPIVSEDALTRPDRHLFVGAGTVMRASPAGFDPADLGEEDLRIRVTPQHVALAGGSPRGTLYAVYTFLEDSFGVRFLAPDCTHVPRLRLGQRLPCGDTLVRPRFRFRYCYYGDNHRDHAFATRLRNNAMTTDPRLGGRTGWDVINHSVSGWVPVRRYGAEHPEYFALVNGRRRGDVPDDHYGGGGGTQPCMTNPEVRRLVTEGALAQLAKEPWRACISVSQNDNEMYCRCPACAAVDAREESHMGALLTLVNGVADAVAAQRPGVFVGTLAYQYSRRPPKTLRPRPNVAFQLCSIECCVLHPIDDPACPLNRPFCADLEGWSRLSDQIYVWNYNVNFHDYLSPLPNLGVIGPNVRYFAARGVRGLFMQAAGGARATDFQELRNYLICRLLWDPAADDRALIDEFVTLYYGRAAPAMREYLTLLGDSARIQERHRACFGRAADYGIDDDTARCGQTLLARALRRAESDEVRRRVGRAALGLERMALQPFVEELRLLLDVDAFGDAVRPYQLKADARLAPESAARWRAPLEAFLSACRTHEVNLVTETMTLDVFEALSRRALGLPAVAAP